VAGLRADGRRALLAIAPNTSYQWSILVTSRLAEKAKGDFCPCKSAVHFYGQFDKHQQTLPADIPEPKFEKSSQIIGVYRAVVIKVGAGAAV